MKTKLEHVEDDQCMLVDVEVEDSGRKKKKKNKLVSKGSVVDKDTMMDSSADVEEDEKEDDTTSDNEEREEEINCGIADENVRRKKKTTDRMMFDGEKKKAKRKKKNKEIDSSAEVEEEEKADDTASDSEEREEDINCGIADENVRRKKKTTDRMMFDGEKKKAKRKKKNKEKDDLVVGCENVGKVKKIKKDKRNHMMLPDDKEMELKKIAKVKEKSNGIKAHNKGKKRKRKEPKDVQGADNEEQNRLKVTKQDKKVEVNSLDGLVRGKRYSEEEDELIKKAVSDYIEAKQLGDDGLKMILNCKSCPQVKGCWQAIGTALPWRPCFSIYFRAHRLYAQGERKYTLEELEYIGNTYKKYGPQWTMMANKLGKCKDHVRSAFQRYKFGNLNKGKWSQDEYQALFEQVNKDLQEKVYEEKRSKYGMLKDNISWEAISLKIGTRSSVRCCAKWYRQLTSSMVAEGKWADVDDYRLLMVLVDLDASCEDEVDWDDLLEHTPGDLCRKRWLQMVRHLGEHGNKSFSEQVDVLSKRYCPDLAEIREAMDARPIVD